MKRFPMYTITVPQKALSLAVAGTLTLASVLAGAGGAQAAPQENSAGMSRPMPGMMTMNGQHPSMPNPSVLKTSGHGEVTLKPDSVEVVVGVENEAKTMEAAREENARLMRQVQQAVKQLNIKDITFQTSNFNAYPVYNYGSKEPRPSKPTGYRISHQLNIEVEQQVEETLSKITSEIVDAALSEGATNTGQIRFYRKNMDAAMREATQQAVAEAREHAQVMAQAAGVQLDRLILLEGHPQANRPQPIYGYAPMMARASAMDAKEASPVEPGEITVQADVNAEYALRP